MKGVRKTALKLASLMLVASCGYPLFQQDNDSSQADNSGAQNLDQLTASSGSGVAGVGGSGGSNY